MVEYNKKIEDLLIGLSYKIIFGSLLGTINKVCVDTRKIEDGDLFVCIKGFSFDSHTKLDEIISLGAKYIIVEEDNENIKNVDNDSVCIIEVADTKKALAIILKNYYKDLLSGMVLIGITGTKGKTTTAFMIKGILEAADNKVGMIGTIGILYDDKIIETANTTPDIFTLYQSFAAMKDAGVTYIVMEVSSQSLKYDRVYGLSFDYGVFTNIAPEHIGTNEHTDYEDYLMSKLKIFSQSKVAIINTKTNDLDRIKKAAEENNNNVVYIDSIEHFDIDIPGDYNQLNANVANAVCKAIGIDNHIILDGLKNVKVPGRCELVYKNDDMEIIVDFAHEQNGARKFLSTMREYVSKSEKLRRIVLVFGCGGNRAKERRYGMGTVAGELSDFVILTEDNSRYENVLDIIFDIESTLSKYKKKDDLENGYVIREQREKAIEYAIKMHKTGDLICVIGKGHENTIETNGIKTYFSDQETILKYVC